MWHENGAGDFYWPLHGERQEDHLRVWKLAGKWHGALVIDGEYVLRIEPQRKEEAAREAVYALGRDYVQALFAGFLL